MIVAVYKNTHRSHFASKEAAFGNHMLIGVWKVGYFSSVQIVGYTVE